MALYVIQQGGDPQETYALIGGLAAWEEAGYPVSKGTDEG